MYDWQAICSQAVHVSSCIKLQHSLYNSGMLPLNTVWYNKIALGACPGSNWAVEVLQYYVCKSLQSRHGRKSNVLLYPIYYCLAYVVALANIVDPNTRKQDPACMISNLQDSAILLYPVATYQLPLVPWEKSLCLRTCKPTPSPSTVNLCVFMHV